MEVSKEKEGGRGKNSRDKWGVSSWLFAREGGGPGEVRGGTG